MEIVGPSRRAWAGLLINLFWCGGEFLLVLMAYFIRSWRYLAIALSVPSVGLLFYWWLIPESPRWLSSRGRHKETLQILERIARSNGTRMPPVEDATALIGNKAVTQGGLCHAVRSKELMLRMFIVVSNMFVITVLYLGLSLNITNLSGNLFVNFAINAALEMLGYCLCLVLLDRLGRKPVFSGSLFLAGGACALSCVPVLLQWPSWVVLCLSIVGRFAVGMAYATIFCYGAEVFPTVIRSSAMGLGITFSRLGAIISPFIADVGFLVKGPYVDALPLLVMGSPALLVAVMSLWLPETLHATLPDTMDDLKKPAKE